jgi:diguanylate cyclase (GGDEF)-like protein/PAS domain S-box-containing protein
MTYLLGLLAVALLAFALLSRQAAARATASERRMRRLVGHSPELVVALVDHDTRITLFEGLALERAGWRAGELVGRTIEDAIPSVRAQELLPHVRMALEGHGSSLEWAGVRSDAVFRIDVLPFGENGQITHAALTFRDIGGERGLQLTLQEQRGFLSAVLAELGERVRVADSGGRLLSFDGSDIDDDLHPLEWSEHFGLHHPNGTPFGPHEAPLLRALRGEQVRAVEVHVDTAEGRRALLESGGPVVAADGRRLGAVVVNADLTAFREAEDRLRRSEERHRRVLESMSDCVFETDERGLWTHLSETWTHATGYAVEDSLGRPAWEFVHPEDRSEHARAFAPLLSGERAALRHSHRFLTVAGAVRWAEVQVRAISGWDGLPTGFVGVIRDVTDERRSHQHTAAEQAVMRLLAAADGIEDAGSGLLEILGHELDWDGAELWRMAGDERLRRAASWTAPGAGLDRFMAAGERLVFEVGDGFPGQAWMSRVPLWRAAIADTDGFTRAEEAVADGLSSTVALPLRAGGAPAGVVVLVSRTPREPETGLERLLEGIGGQVTQFLHRREAEARVAAQAADLKTLSGVAHELAAQDDMFAARMTLCRAVRDVTGSASVTLWEPVLGGSELEVSAAVGAGVRGLRNALDGRAPTAVSFLSRELSFEADVAAHSILADWHDVSGAASAAWVPVVHGDRAVGVLAVGWPSVRASLPERDEELLRLLAAEAAITIHRTDLLARLQSTARTDPLTGLPNRRVWDEDLEREIARARRHGGSLCLAMLDLDRFKTFNDEYGHQAGDQLLAATAAAWRPALRATDTIARYGGEEFAVLLPHSDQDAALIVVERLLEVVPLGQTASAGVAVWDGSESAEELLARADAALYRAKGAGRARACIA